MKRRPLRKVYLRITAHIQLNHCKMMVREIVERDGDGDVPLMYYRDKSVSHGSDNETAPYPAINEE